MSGLIFHLIAHTHWDREWYLPRATFHARLVSMLDDLIERLQADAGFRTFLLDGQTVLLEDYLRARPERENDLKALVKTGRLQIGPWYVLADELIPSGESLIRNLLLGPAGRDILLWHLPRDGYEIGAGLPGAGARLLDVWTQVRATLVQRAAGKHIPLFIGADHHAPHPTLARLRDLLADL